MKKYVLIIAVLVSVVAGLGYKLLSDYLHAPIRIKDGDAIFQVESGASLKRVSRELEKLGVLSHATWLDIYARIRGLTNIKWENTV
jgi:cell division protein YceG involved in septum cleavage